MGLTSHDDAELLLGWTVAKIALEKRPLAV